VAQAGTNENGTQLGQVTTWIFSFIIISEDWEKAIDEPTHVLLDEHFCYWNWFARGALRFPLDDDEPGPSTTTTTMAAR
jgi:hypothetical protein